MEQPWYPGHMHRAVQQIKIIVAKCDYVLLLGDARMAINSFNYEPIINNPIDFKRVKIHKIFTKVDRISSKKYAELRANNPNAYFAEYTYKNFRRHFTKWLQRIVGKNHFFTSCLIMGIPNVGKSTFIRHHCVGKQIMINKKPGSTRGVSCIRFSPTINLYDTPGISFRQQTVFANLAKLVICNLIKSSLYDIEPILIYGLLYLHTQHLDTLHNLFPKINMTNYKRGACSGSVLLASIQENYFARQKLTVEFMNKWILRRIQDKANCEWE